MPHPVPDRYIEARIKVPNEVVEVVCDFIIEHIASGIVLEEEENAPRTGIIFYVPDDNQTFRSELEAFLPTPAAERPGCEITVISDYSDVGRAVRASCAIPGLFQPVEIRGMRLLDGGVLDQVPVDIVRAMGADVTVGVSLGLSYHKAKLAHPSDALADMVSLLGVQQLRKSLDMADVGFQLEGIEERSVLKTHQTDLISRGEKAMHSHMNELFLLIEQRQGFPG